VVRDLGENFSASITPCSPGEPGRQAAREPSAASIDLLCAFLASPFANVDEARELLSQIEGRSIHDAELERATFCFQIALYFLACLAIASRVDDPDLQRSCITRLYDRVRRFYADTNVTAKFSDFVVATDERDQFATGLRELWDRTGEKHGDMSRMVMTKLGIFDLVGVRRMQGYHEVLGHATVPRRFSLVAEQLLLHYGAKRYHSAVVAMIADFLSANYGILSKIVLSHLCPEQTQDAESEAPGLGLDPSLPDITNAVPSKVYLSDKYLLLLVEDVGPMGTQGSIRFRYVLAVCDRRRRLPLCFVTLEDSASIANVLCVFEANGSHSNYGALQGRDLRKAFMDKAMDLASHRFDLGRIEELSRPSRPDGRQGKRFAAAVSNSVATAAP
jgi:hypothetical protein